MKEIIVPPFTPHPWNRDKQLPRIINGEIMMNSDAYWIVTHYPASGLYRSQKLRFPFNGNPKPDDFATAELAAGVATFKNIKALKHLKRCQERINRQVYTFEMHLEGYVDWEALGG